MTNIFIQVNQIILVCISKKMDHLLQFQGKYNIKFMSDVSLYNI